MTIFSASTSGLVRDPGSSMTKSAQEAGRSRILRCHQGRRTHHKDATLGNEDECELTRADADADEPAALLLQLRDSHDCSASLVLRLRVIGTAHHMVRQCSVCGEQRGGPVSKRNALGESGGVIPPPFDISLHEAYAARRADLVRRYQESRAALDPEGVSDSMDAARAISDAIAGVDAAVDALVELATRTLPGDTAPRVILSRLDKARMGFKARLDDDATFFRDEVELRGWLDEWIAQDFEVWREVSGQHPGGARVHADYLLYPKPALVSAGFKPAHFVLEAKYLDPNNGFTRKASRLVWQAVSYTDSQFDLPAPPSIQPAFAVLFTNLSFDNEHDRLHFIGGSPRENDRAAWAAMLQVANHANVGQLRIVGGRDSFAGWTMAFAGGTYFRRVFRGGSSVYRLSTANMVDKVRVGNF